MPRSCSTCQHPERKVIDRALVVGESNRSVASKFDLSEAAIRRHRTNHLPATLAQARTAEEIAQADDLLEQVRALQAQALAILARAEAAGDLRAALGAIREARSNAELLAKVLGALDERPVNVLISPQWVELRTAIILALEPHPDARESVVRAIEGAANGSA